MYVHQMLQWQSGIHINSPVASAPTNLRTVQEDLTSIRVFWSPPTLLGNTTGYRIYYTSNRNGTQSVDVKDGSRNNYLLAGLQNGDIFDISIAATSQHLMNIQLGKSEILCVLGTVSYFKNTCKTLSRAARDRSILNFLLLLTTMLSGLTKQLYNYDYREYPSTSVLQI